MAGSGTIAHGPLQVHVFGGGTWLSHDPWGRRRLAYSIRKQTEGQYVLMQTQLSPAATTETVGGRRSRSQAKGAASRAPDTVL